MAVVSTLVGGVFGFWSALIAFLVLDLSLTHALLVYMGVGLLTCVITILFVLVARTRDKPLTTAVSITR